MKLRVGCLYHKVQLTGELYDKGYDAATDTLYARYRAVCPVCQRVYDITTGDTAGQVFKTVIERTQEGQGE